MSNFPRSRRRVTKYAKRPIKQKGRNERDYNADAIANARLVYDEAFSSVRRLRSSGVVTPSYTRS